MLNSKFKIKNQVRRMKKAKYISAYTVWKNIYRFKNRYYKVIDADIPKKEFLIKECKKVLWFYRELNAHAFWIDEKIFFKKYEKVN